MTKTQNSVLVQSLGETETETEKERQRADLEFSFWLSVTVLTYLFAGFFFTAARLL